MVDDNHQLVLDTNILVHLARWKKTGREINREYNLLSRKERAVLSFVTTAENLVLARRFGWGEEKRAFVDKLRPKMVVAPLDRRVIVEHYVELDAFSRENGETMGKNDIWIAATAVALDAHLLTCDDDFDHLGDEFLDLVRFDADNGGIVKDTT